MKDCTYSIASAMQISLELAKPAGETAGIGEGYIVSGSASCRGSPNS